jgi:hypothetical protein
MARGLLAAVIAALAGCAGATPRAREIQEVGAPAVYDARVVASRGPLVPQRGDACRIEVIRTDHEVYTCRIVIECRGDVVYGLADGGYNVCYAQGERFVFARDRAGTRADGDPRLFFDLLGGQVRVTDDAPDVDLEIDVSGLPEQYQRGTAPDPDDA